VENVIDTRNEYEAPAVKTEDVFVRSALSCAGALLSFNIKDYAAFCGFSDS